MRAPSDWASARASALIAGLGSAAACAAFFALAPGEWFARIDRLSIVQKPWGEVLIVERRAFWPGDALLVEWRNAIHEAPRRPPDDDAPGALVCAGTGSWSLRGDASREAAIPVGDWVSGDACGLHAGGRYVAVAEWRFTVFGISKQSMRMSDPARIEPVAGP